MNDLVSLKLRRLLFVLVACSAGALLSWLGLSVDIADLAGRISQRWKTFLDLWLFPILGLGFAEYLSLAGPQRSFWRVSPRWLKTWLQDGTPDLSGEWNVEWLSNSTVNEALYEVYSGRARPERALSDLQLGTYSGSAFLTITPVEVTVRLKTAHVTEPNNSSSARLYRDDRGQVVLEYQADAVVGNKTARDAERYHFAGRLTYNPDNDTLSGHYYTDREWRIAQNTAGRITMKRRFG